MAGKAMRSSPVRAAKLTTRVATMTTPHGLDDTSSLKISLQVMKKESFVLATTGILMDVKHSLR